ncbi:MAG TPA: CBS domain-containing protein [Mycobacteriales bacterium]|nr:CBS domain-containing protein [Mycobacteriales bacterium]
MRVREVMTEEVITVDVDTPVSTAVSLLAKHDVTTLPVIGDGRLVGVVGESDLLRHEIPHQGSEGYDGGFERLADGAQVDSQTVADVMTTPVVAVPDDADTGHVAGLMLDYDVRSVPVVDGTRVTGIISRRDLIRMLVHDDDRVAEEVRRRLRDYSGDQGHWTVQVAEGIVTVDGDLAYPNERRVVELLTRTVPGARSVRIGPADVAGGQSHGHSVGTGEQTHDRTGSGRPAGR